MIHDSPIALVGRAAETGKLSQALDEGLSRVVLTGAAGVGKSALARVMANLLRDRRAFIGFGKHGVGESGAAPLLRAIRQLIDEALEELFEPAAGLEQLRAAMGPVQPLFDALMLERKTMPIGIQRTDARIEQFAQVLECSFAWLAGFGVPLALIIDDWDRASAEVQALYWRIPDLSRSQPVCLIATGRTWPNHTDHSGDGLFALQLAGLDRHGRRALLVSCLGEADGTALDSIIPAAINRPLDLIERSREVAIQIASGKSVSDPATLAAALRDELPALLSDRLRTLPADALDLALLLATLGDATDLAIARTASGLTDKAFDAAAQALVAERIVVVVAPTIAFAHDTIRTAVTLVASSHPTTAAIAHSAAQRLRTRAEIGAESGVESSAEWEATSDSASDIAALTAIGELLLAYPPSVPDASWIEPLSALTNGALRSLDTQRAVQLAQLALAMDGGLVDASIETLKLRAVTAMIDQDHATAGQCTERLRRLSHRRADVAFAFALSADLARAKGEREEAITAALAGHRKLGWNIPDAPSRLATLRDILWANLVGDMLRALPLQAPGPDTDILRLCAATSTVFYEYGTPHVVSVARHFALSRETRSTSAGISAAVFMANFLRRNRKASKLAEKILALETRGELHWPTSAYRAQFFGRLWTRPARSFRAVTDTLHVRAVAEGDIPVATWLLRHKAHLAWRSGDNLASVEQMAHDAIAFAQRVGNKTTAGAAMQIMLATRLLRGLPTDPATTIDPYCPHTLDTPLLTWLAYHNYRGDFAQSVELLARLPRKPSISLASHPGLHEFQFHRAVAMLATGGRFWPEDLRGLVRAAKLCPEDHHARLHIVKALKARHRGQIGKAFRYMTQAVQACDAQQRPHDQSLASCMAADLARMLHYEADAAIYLGKAKRAWSEWGAEPDCHVRLRQCATTDDNDDWQRLAERLEQSERENRAKSRLLALVGHELRTPLQAISGAVDLIRLQGGARDELSIVTASLDRLSAMVDDLSAVTALETGELAVNPRAFSLATLLRQIVDTHAAPLRAAGLTLSLDVAHDDRIWLSGDDKRLQQILDNLLTNARKYGAGEVLVKVRCESDTWLFEVSDQGPGLAPEQALRIFEPFVRGASAAASPGHGIGLWLSRKLAENMGGNLRLAPDDGGAQFILTLPLPAAQAPCDSPDRPWIKNTVKRVLLVEDEPLSRDVITRMLEHDGHLVQAFSSGQEAIDLLAASGNANHYDMAMIDGNLPDLTGLATADRLRATAGAACRIILITAQVTQEHVLAQQSRRIDRVVQKPLSIKVIRSLLGATQGAATSGIDVAADPAAMDHLRAYFGAIWQAFAQEQWGELITAAHKLAGAAMIVDLPDLGRKGIALEAAARATDCDSASKIIADMAPLLIKTEPGK